MEYFYFLIIELRAQWEMTTFVYNILKSICAWQLHTFLPLLVYPYFVRDHNSKLPPFFFKLNVPFTMSAKMWPSLHPTPPLSRSLSHPIRQHEQEPARMAGLERVWREEQREQASVADGARAPAARAATRWEASAAGGAQARHRWSIWKETYEMANTKMMMWCEFISYMFYSAI